MLQASDNCNADQWGVYVYNDFSGYGQLELLENAVSFPEDIGRTKILVKDYVHHIYPPLVQRNGNRNGNKIKVLPCT